MGIDILFRRSKGNITDCDPADWDDSYLIRAYDYSVTRKPEEIKAPSPPGPQEEVYVVDNDEHGFGISKFGGESRIEQTKMKTTSSGMIWNAGDECMALFYPDGQYYQAVIQDVSSKDGTAMVKFVAYEGDDEKLVNIEDVHPRHLWENDGAPDPQGDAPAKKKKKKKKKATVEEPPKDSLPPPVAESRARNLDSRARKPLINDRRVPPPERHAPPPVPKRNVPQPPPPPAPPGFMGGVPTFPSEPALSTLPAFRDIGKPCLNGFNKETLSNMLVSWYMAGYYTGYYRGASKDSADPPVHNPRPLPPQNTTVRPPRDARMPDGDGPRSQRDGMRSPRDVPRPSGRSKPPPPDVRDIAQSRQSERNRLMARGMMGF